MTSRNDTTSAPVEYRTIARFEGYRFGDDGSIWTCLVRVYASSGRPGRGTLRYIPGDEWRRMSVTLTPQGYLSVSLRNKTYRAHRLILEAFGGSPPAGTECRHLDGVRTNNRRENLQWATHSENEKDKSRHGHRPDPEICPNAKLTWAKVAEIRRLRAEGASLRSLSHQFGVGLPNLSVIINNKTWIRPPA